MKKIALLLLIAITVMCIAPYTAVAESERIFENDPVLVPKAAPTVDGKIDANEGWSKVCYLNEDTAGYFYGNNQLTSVTDCYFAYSEEGLYFGAVYNEYHAAYTVRFYDDEGASLYNRSYIDPKAGTYTSENYPKTTPDGTVIEAALQPPAFDKILPENGKNAFWFSTQGNTTCYSEGDDLVDKVYGWDGDVIALMIDPNGVFNSAKLFGDSDYTPQYNLGIFNEDGKDTVKVKTSRSSDDDITSVCKAAGKLTEDSITYEVFIPWAQIVKDMNDMAKKFNLEHTFTIDEMIADGAVHRASVTLMDRFMDEEAGYIDSWGRFVTVCDVCDDGMKGFIVGPPVKAMGLKLNIESADYGDNPQNGSENENGNGTLDSADKSENNKNGTTTTKAASTNKGTNSGTSANTFDSGIIIVSAIGLVAIIGVAVVFKKHING